MRSASIVALLIGLGIIVAGCGQDGGCSSILLCASSQAEAERLNAQSTCKQYGYCVWLDAGGDGSPDGNGLLDAPSADVAIDAVGE